MKRITVTLATVLLIGVSSQSWAVSGRCGNKVIDSGSGRLYKEDVLKQCGQPDGKEGSVWRYHTQRFTYVFSFDADGAVASITQEPRS